MPPKKTQIYQKKDPLEHVIDRPDMYVGSVRLRTTEEFVVTKDDDNKFTIDLEPQDNSQGCTQIEYTKE